MSSDTTPTSAPGHSHGNGPAKSAANQAFSTSTTTPSLAEPVNADSLARISLKRPIADTDSGGSGTDGSSSMVSTEPSTTPSDISSGNGSHKKLRFGSSRQQRRSRHLQTPHPFGIKPLGNAFLSDRNDRAVTFGQMAMLDDDLIMHMLSLFIDDISTLARLESVSHGFHAYINASNSLWRDAFLQTFEGKMKRWCGSWKRTFAWHHKLAKLVRAGTISESFNGSNLVLLEPPQPPIRSPYLFSDTAFHPFRLAMAPIEHLLAPEVGHLPIQRIDVSKQGSVAAFREKHAEANFPAIIEGAMSPRDWTCREWSLETLAVRWPNRFFQCEAVRCQLPAYVSYSKGMQELVDQGQRDDEDDQSVVQRSSIVNPTSPPTLITSSSPSGECGDIVFDPNAVPDESPFYLFDATFADDPHASLEWRVPKIFHQICATSPDASGDHAGVRSDLFSLLGPLRPDHRWIIAGPKRSGSGWHKDPNGTSAWNAVLTGRKAWMMLPPHITPPGVYVSEDEAEVTAPVSIAEWLLGFAQETRKMYGPSAPHPEDRVLLEGVCEAGQVLYVPSGWWHLVVNLEESVALTQNFVSPAELGVVLDFMKNKADQLSGFKKSQRNTLATTCTMAPGRMPNTVPQSRLRSKDAIADDDEGECEDGAGFGVFELFCERLGKFDKQLLEEGLAGMRKIEDARLGETGSRSWLTSSLSRVSKTRGRGTGEAGIRDTGNVVETWWERLKKGGTQDMPEQQAESGLSTDTNAAPASSMFSLAGDLADEELDEVPW